MRWVWERSVQSWLPHSPPIIQKRRKKQVRADKQTIQSISLLAYLAEHHNLWGPFLVIAPASTLHNWQQELARFVPRLKALPYWGSPKDRETLRKIWSRKNMTFSESSPFHILVTSYQLVCPLFFSFDLFNSSFTHSLCRIAIPFQENHSAALLMGFRTVSWQVGGPGWEIFPGDEVAVYDSRRGSGYQVQFIESMEIATIATMSK